MRLFSHDLGVDLGTSNILIYKTDEGIVAREPAVVAVDRNTGKILQVGAAARNMLGRTPGNVVAMHPLKDGVVCDHEMTVKMLQHMFRVTDKSRLFTPKPRVVVSVPSGITEIEERTVINAALEAGARRVYLIEEPLAAALGAGLDISQPTGHMVINIGGGTTNIAILSMNGVANAASLKLGGNHFDDAIVRYIRRRHQIIIGQNTAEDIKMQVGAVYPREEASITVKGRDSRTGMPRELTITVSELLEQKVLLRLVHQIIDEISSVLEDTSAELVGDLAETGIVLTGGGSQLYGIDRLIQEITGIPCAIADDPASCVAYGCGKSLAWITRMTEGPINLARKRLMRG